MKILVIGSGGREHAIVRALKKSPRATDIYVLPGNGGISADAVCVPGSATDVAGAVDFAREIGADFAVVTPDDPLCLGMADALEHIGVPVFGPSKAAAQIEGSKVFAKGLMRKYGIPTAACEVFDDFEAALAYVDAAPLPIVVKADGLALGKGVTVAQTREEARSAVRAAMCERVFGESGERLVIEEYLEGPEVSVLSFTDGHTLVPMVSSMDHKRALDGDLGPNTGGMGTVAPNPWYTPEIAAECMERIFLPTMRAMNAEGRTFRGCLYFGLMLTKDGPKVIEYNCRFGDPETQVVLPLLDTDLLEIMEATAAGRLAEVDIRWKPGSACCVILASGGYPKAYKKGLPISGLEENGQLPGEPAEVFHAGTKLESGRYYTNGGRVLGITATASSLEEAVSRAYAAADRISFEGLHRRGDIGARALSAPKD
ncbi:MAG TPA: phosphoribosylamine--glycine ligase [Candidatus Scatomorpha merdavium]|nr:phosphoribosylamine--glycine ligase [Candidatus Scatomorpha merdavium]